MAFSVELRCFLLHEAAPALKIPLPWWNQRELRSQYRFTRKYDGGFLDFFLEVSPEELDQIHRTQLKYLDQGTYASPQWRKQIEPVREQIEALLQHPFDYPVMQVHIFEWESGLG